MPPCRKNDYKQRVTGSRPASPNNITILPRIHKIVTSPPGALGQPSTQRADHLFDVSLPMLFLQGARDTFTELKLLRPICLKLGERATLRIIEGADHSFHMPKSSASNDEQVLEELARILADWVISFMPHEGLSTGNLS